jgi:uncharacterized protein (DUF433 family)
MLNTVEQTINEKELYYNRPIYYASETARFIDISKYRVRRWVQGYHYKSESGHYRKLKSLIRENNKEKKYSSYVSFYELIDLIFVKAFLQHGLSLQIIRRALDEAKSLLQTEHFARKNFFTDGSNICLQIGREGDAIQELLSGGQWVISEIITSWGKQIDFDKHNEMARQWFPKSGNNLVVLDPLRSYGKPIIHKKGVPTENIYDLYLAEGKKIKPVCDWYDVTQEEVDAAIEFERKLAA